MVVGSGAGRTAEDARTARLLALSRRRGIPAEGESVATTEEAAGEECKGEAMSGSESHSNEDGDSDDRETRGGVGDVDVNDDGE